MLLLTSLVTMRLPRCFLAAVLVALVSLPTEGFAQESPVDEARAEAAAADVTPENRRLRHVVAVTFAADASQEAIQTLTGAFRKLKRLPGVVAFEHGAVTSGEMAHRHAYTFLFESRAAFEAYESHPDHQALRELAGDLGIVEGVLVVDYIARE